MIREAVGVFTPAGAGERGVEMERLEVGRDTVFPNDDLEREYVLKKEIYLKIYPEGEPKNFLILPAGQSVDLSHFQGNEIGDKFTVEIIEMTVTEYAALPEWDGF